MFVGSFIPNWILKSKDLTSSDKLVYARLSQYAGKDGECFPKQETIAEECGMSERTVGISIKNLIEHKFIEIEKRGQGKPIIYYFLENGLFNTAILEPQNLRNRNRRIFGTGTAESSEHSTKENQLKESIKREEPSVSKNLINEDQEIFNVNTIHHIEEEDQERIKKLRRDWEVFALSINLIDKTYPEDIYVLNCLADPLFDFAKIKANIANSKRLRGIGKGNSKANAVSFEAIIKNSNLRQQIMDGDFDDSKQKTAVIFADSKQYNWEVFKYEMQENETFKEKYTGANIKHYYDELKSWSKRNQKKSFDWIEEALNFMRLDSEGRGLKIGNGETKTFTIREGYGQS